MFHRFFSTWRPEEGSSDTPFFPGCLQWFPPPSERIELRQTLTCSPPPVCLSLWMGVKVAGGSGTKQCLGTANNGLTWTWEREGNKCHNAWKPPTGDVKIKPWIQLAVYIHSYTHNEQRQEACRSSKTYTTRGAYIKENCSTRLKAFPETRWAAAGLCRRYF